MVLNYNIIIQLALHMYNVTFPKQVLSESCLQGIGVEWRAGGTGMATFVSMVDKFFDFLNVSNFTKFNGPSTTNHSSIVTVMISG